jgi:hypothetical protein
MHTHNRTFAYKSFDIERFLHVSMYFCALALIVTYAYAIAQTSLSYAQVVQMHSLFKDSEARMLTLEQHILEKASRISPERAHELHLVRVLDTRVQAVVRTTQVGAYGEDSKI